MRAGYVYLILGLCAPQAYAAPLSTTQKGAIGAAGAVTGVALVGASIGIANGRKIETGEGEHSRLLPAADPEYAPRRAADTVALSANDAPPPAPFAGGEEWGAVTARAEDIMRGSGSYWEPEIQKQLALLRRNVGWVCERVDGRYVLNDHGAAVLNKAYRLVKA